MGTKSLLLFVCVLPFLFSKSQEVFLKVRPTFSAKDSLIIGKKFYLEETQDSVEITAFKMYISNISVIEKNKRKKIEPTYFLVDSEDKNSYNIKFPNRISENSKLQLSIGTDLDANVSGAMKGALDPINGMYWVWQSGYINIKIEGFSKKLNDNFTYHLGGYQAPYETVRDLIFDVKKLPLVINVNLQKFLLKVDYLKNTKLMQPGSKAKEYTDDFINAISTNEQ